MKAGSDSLKAKPANLTSNEPKTLVKLGNLEDDFGVVGDAHRVCEAIVGIKDQAQIDGTYRRGASTQWDHYDEHLGCPGRCNCRWTFGEVSKKHFMGTSTP